MTSQPSSIKTTMRLPEKTPVKWAVWPLWALATTAGITLGFVFSYVVLFAIKAVVRDFNEDKWMGYWLVPILAVGVTVLQWLILRRYIARAGGWIVASLSGWVIAIFVSQFITRSLYALWPRITPADWALYSFIIILFAFGLVMGTIQWLVLRQHVRGAGVWMLANVAGLAVARWMIGVSIDRFADVVALGALPGIVTGLALAWLLRGTAAH